MMPRRLLCLLVLMLGVGPVCAQEAVEPPIIPATGTEVFCWLLKNRGFAAVSSFHEARTLRPDETLVIALGRGAGEHLPPDVAGSMRLSHLRLALGSLREFQERGGAVLFANDSAHEWLPEWGILVADARAGQDDRFSYRHRSECPLLTLAPTAPAELQPVRQRIATNRPSHFITVSPDAAAGLKTLADFRRHCKGTVWSEAEHRADTINEFKLPERRITGETPLPYILLSDTGQRAHGRAMLIAGHGLFTNAMLLQKDNDNLQFANDCLRWLQHAPAQKRRTHALLVVDGQVIPSFDTALKPPVPPPLPTPTVRLVDQLLAGMERENFFSRLFEEFFDVPGTAGVAIAVLTGLLLLYGGKRTAGQRHRAEAGAVLTTGPLAVKPTMTPLVRDRVRAQAARGAFWAEARTLARAWFHETAGVTPAAWDAAPTPAPLADLTGGWWQRRRLRAQVERLGRLAAEREPAAFSWAALVRLTRLLHTLTAEHRAGRLRFADGAAAQNS